MAVPKHPLSHVSVKSAPVVATTPVKDTIRPSLFTGHALPKEHLKPQLHYTNYDYAIAGVLFLTFLFFVWIFVRNRKRLVQVIKAFYVNRVANQLLREEVTVVNRISVLLSCLFVVTLSLFMAQVNRYFGWFDLGENGLDYLLIAGAIVVAYGAKIVTVRFLGFVFQLKKEASDYLFSLFLFGNALGLFLLPVVVCLAFVKQVETGIFVYIGNFLVVTFIGVRIIRGVLIGFNSLRVSKFYLFLYLCTLEIMPLMILLKIGLNHFKMSH